MNLFTRTFILFKRKIIAKSFGLNFLRSAKWKLPSYIYYHGKKYTILADDEHGTGTRDAFLDIFLDDEYNIRNAIKKISVKTIVDIGGHSGFFSMYCKLLLPHAKVHCYEPNPQLSEFVKHQSKESEFIFYPEAVGKENGRVHLEIFGETIHSRTSIDEKGSIVQTSFKECLNRIGGQIDILKLDCEGAEWDIMKDTDSFKHVKFLTMEYHLINGKSIDEIKEMIDKIGFNIIKFKITGHTWGMLFAENKRMKNA